MNFDKTEYPIGCHLVGSSAGRTFANSHNFKAAGKGLQDTTLRLMFLFAITSKGVCEGWEPHRLYSRDEVFVAITNIHPETSLRDFDICYRSLPNEFRRFLTADAYGCASQGAFKPCLDRQYVGMMMDYAFSAGAEISQTLYEALYGAR